MQPIPVEGTFGYPSRSPRDSPRRELLAILVLTAVLLGQCAQGSFGVPPRAGKLLVAAAPSTSVVPSLGTDTTGKAALRLSPNSSALSVVQPAGSAYVVDDEHLVPFIPIDPGLFYGTVLIDDPYSRSSAVALSTQSPYAPTTVIVNYTSGTNRTLNMTSGLPAGGGIFPGNMFSLTMNGSVILTALNNNLGSGTSYPYPGADIVWPIASMIDYPGFRNESAVNLVVPASGLGYSTNEWLWIDGTWTLDGNVVVGEADVSAYISNMPRARYLYRADLDTPAYANSSRPSSITPLEQVPWNAPLGWGHYYQVSPNLILTVPWNPTTDRWTLFDLVNETWKNYTVHGWDIVWTGRAENALYLLIQTQWLNGVYSYVLDRLNLTGLTNLNTISSLPVKQLLNASFSNPVMYFSVSPYTFGDDLYFFSGTYGYPPVLAPTLYNLSAYNWTTGQSLFNETFGLSLPPPSYLYGSAYPPPATPSPGVLPLFGSVIPDLSRGRLVILNTTALEAAVEAQAGALPCGSGCYTFWVTDLSSTVARVAGMRVDYANRTMRLFSASVLMGHEPPSATFTVTPTRGNGTAVFSVNASAVSSPYQPSATLQVRWDWEGDGSWDTNWTTAKTAFHSYVSSDTFSIALEVMDGQGVTNRTTRTVLADSTPPTTTATVSGELGADNWYITNVVVNLSSQDPLDGVASVSVRVDNGSWAATLGSHATLRLHDGRHFVEYNATDLLGNVEPEHTIVLKIDTVPPDLLIRPPASVVTSSDIVLTWSGMDSGSGLAGYEVGVDGGNFGLVALNESVTLHLSDGTHDVRVKALDQAGNSAVQEVMFRVDTDILSFSGPYAGLPTVAIIVGVMAAVAYFFWKRRRPPGT